MRYEWFTGTGKCSQNWWSGHRYITGIARFIATFGRWAVALRGKCSSNQVSVLHVNRQGNLTLTDVASSEGVDPVSLTYSAGHPMLSMMVMERILQTFLVSICFSGNLYASHKQQRPSSAANSAAGEIRQTPSGPSSLSQRKIPIL